MVNNDMIIFQAREDMSRERLRYLEALVLLPPPPPPPLLYI